MQLGSMFINNCNIIVLLDIFRTLFATETYRVILQLLINILPSCITLVLYIRILTYDARKLKHKIQEIYS